METTKAKTREENLRSKVSFQLGFLLHSGASVEDTVNRIVSYSMKKIDEAQEQAVDEALKMAAERIESEYDFDGEYKSENYPAGIVNTKVKQSILSLRSEILSKLK